jgi:hypothetical protein
MVQIPMHVNLSTVEVLMTERWQVNATTVVERKINAKSAEGLKTLHNLQLMNKASVEHGMFREFLLKPIVLLTGNRKR